VPGYFEFSISKGESVVFAAGLEEIDTNTLAELADFEVSVRTPRDNFYNTLVNSAHQFIVHREHEDYVLAGYPWFKCRARDMFVSLPGLTLTNNETDKFEAVMKTAEKAIREFIEGKKLTVSVTEIEHPDVLLWAVWCIQQYANFVSMEKCIEKYGQLLWDIMEWLRSGGHPNFNVEKNGLVSCEGRDKAVTWMNSSVGGRPIVPRTGFIVEINALWYNALMFSAEVCRIMKDKKFVKQLEAAAQLCQKNFAPMFLNEYGYLCDYCVDGYRDYDVRPNMVFAIALDYSPLDRVQQKSVLDYCTKELITPKGMRSLSPKSHGYNPMYVGPQIQRDYAYHQGTAWPWLAAFYMEACLKIFKYSKLSYVDRLLVGYEEELFYHCIGTIPELFDGNPPFHGRGAISFAMNVSGIMRIVKLLDKYNEE
jgi:predicted glycogen debranching enzyme